MKSQTAVLNDPQQSLKVVQGGGWVWGYSVLWEKSAEQAFRWLEIFGRRLYEPNCYISSYLENHKNRKWCLLFLVTSSNLQETSGKLLQTCVLDCMS